MLTDVLYTASVYRDASGNVLGVFAAARDVTERNRAERLLRARERQQQAVAELGYLALSNPGLVALLDAAALAVARALEVEFTKVLELRPDGDLLLRAEIGFDAGLVGHAVVAGGTGSEAGYVLLAGEPVIVEDLGAETRFQPAALLTDHGVRSGVTNAGDNPLHVSGISWSGRYLEPREDGPPRPVAVASGAALLVRRADFEALGRFQPAYFAYQDDVDLAWRARLAGRRVVFCPRATVRHDYEFAKGAYKWFLLERNRLWTVLSCYSAPALVLLAPLLVGAELAILAVSVRDGWWREKLRAYRALWRGRDELRRWRAGVQARRRAPDSELLAAMTGALDTPLMRAPVVEAVDPLTDAWRRLAVVVLRRLSA